MRIAFEARMSSRMTGEAAYAEKTAPPWQRTRKESGEEVNV
jgi:hypothetical protein